nr:alpha/beta hydrolase [Propylenella binzhouense]
MALVGILHIPEGLEEGRKAPAFLALHGFGSNKDNGACVWAAEALAKLGYLVLRFDMRGCGESEGERGRVICMDQVADTRSAVEALLRRPDVDPARIGVLGHSFGAAVAVYAGAVDERIAAVISSGGWGHGERKFRGQHATPEAWARFTGLIEEGKAYRARTGQSFMMNRYDIVPIPEHMRGSLAPGSHLSFPSETAESMMAFNAEDVVHQIAPRPLLLLHSSKDAVTPTEQSIGMFRKAGQPTDLHLIADTNHFMFAERNPRVIGIVEDWLNTYMPPGFA